MAKILVLTVGGSCEPIVNAIMQTNTDFVYFVCSSGSKGSRRVVDGKDKPCRETKSDGTLISLPSIVEQTGLKPENYEIIELDDPDDFQMCYDRLCDLKKDMEKRFLNSDLNVIANYTGGTKTMSAVLVVFSLFVDWNLQHNVGKRVDLIRVRSGDIPVPVEISKIRLYQHLRTAKEFIQNYYYGEAVRVIEEAIRNSRYIDTETRKNLITLEGVCKGFYEWDLFCHEKALRLLESHGQIVGNWLGFLKKLINVQKQWEGGYEEIEDILLNAERRGVQNRFDDAVARLYRAVELLAQVRLKKQYKLDTSNLDMSKVPESVRKKIIPDDDGKVRIGQRWAYEILASMENEPVGMVYRNWERKLSDALTKRNSSILAHGNIPIDKTTYDEVSNTVNSFINEAFDVIKHKRQMKQFINKFEFLEM